MSFPAYRLIGGLIQRQDVAGGEWTPLSKIEADAILDRASLAEAIPPKLDSIEPEAGGLLPCPFCGGEAKYRADHTTERVDTVSCFRCDFHISDDGDVGSCIAAWNRRASPAPVAVPAGYRLVPEDPTWEMQIAGRDALIDAIDDDNLDTSTDDAKAAYRAMLSASPALASSPETARDRAERREAPKYREPDFIGNQPVLCIHGWTDPNNLCPDCENGVGVEGSDTLGDIERAQSSGEPIAFLSRRALAQFDVNGCEIVDARLYPKGTLRPNEEIAVFSRPQADDGWRPTGHVSIAHDGFAGDIIGHYETREGKRGVVVQQDGTRVVHVYGEKWLLDSAPATGGRE